MLKILQGFVLMNAVQNITDGACHRSCLSGDEQLMPFGCHEEVT